MVNGSKQMNNNIENTIKYYNNKCNIKYNISIEEVYYGTNNIHEQVEESQIGDMNELFYKSLISNNLKIKKMQQMKMKTRWTLIVN